MSARPDTLTLKVRGVVITEIMLEAENWKIALRLYKGHPIPALLLAHQLMAIKQCLERGTKGIEDAIAGLDLPIDGLYPTLTFTRWGGWREQ